MHPTETEKAQHTAEPWHVTASYHNKEDGAFYIRNGQRKLVAVLDTESSIADEANAERIVTCVNACASIPDPASAVPALVGALKLWVETTFTANPDAYAKGIQYVQLNKAAFDKLDAAMALALSALAQGGKR